MSALPKSSAPIVGANGLITPEWLRFFQFLVGEDTTSALSTTLSGKIGGTLGTTDNRITRADGTDGLTAQGSAVTIDDSGNLTGLGTLNGNPIFATATAAEYQANTSGNKALTPDKVWAASAYTALTDAASITIDMNAGFNFSVTISGNRTLANPSNAKVGQAGWFKITASGGTRTVSFGGNYFVTPSITPPVSIASGEICYIFYCVDTTARIIVTAAVNNPT